MRINRQTRRDAATHESERSAVEQRIGMRSKLKWLIQGTPMFNMCVRSAAALMPSVSGSHADRTLSSQPSG